MLLNLREYHRPHRDAEGRGLDRALELLARPDVRTAILAGGNTLLASADPTVEAVVDLQSLGLDRISMTADPVTLRIGAMVTRARLAADEGARQIFGGIIAAGARRWGGSVQRNRATVGGAIAMSRSDDPLAAALLACDARLGLYRRDGYFEVPLSDFVTHRAEFLAASALIVEAIVPRPAAANGGALTIVGRTPADSPIVLAAVALTVQAGRCGAVQVALGGVADTPVRLIEVEQALRDRTLTSEVITAAAARAGELVHPAGDFRGSAEYRRAMAVVLTRRALLEAGRRVEQFSE